MTNAVKNTEAMVVVSQENMLEKLQHSEVITVDFLNLDTFTYFHVNPKFGTVH